MEYENKVVIVTGATGGFGKACVKLFAADGAKLSLFGRSMEKLTALRAELGRTEADCLCFPMNISDEESVKSAVLETASVFGTIDVLVNTAGISGPAVPTEDYTYEDFKAVYETNVFGTFLTMKYALPIMKKNEGGAAICNTGSISGIRGYELECGYGSTKWATIGLTKCVASENSGKVVRVNSISPGWIETKMKDEILANYVKHSGGHPEDYFSTGPMGRPGYPSEMADAVYFLCSSKATYINGANLLVDGGMTIG